MKLSSIIFTITNTIVFILLILLYFYTNNLYPPKVSMEEYHVHKILYIDRHCSAPEVQLISEGAREWQEATHNLATFTILQMPTPIKKSPHESIIINLVSPDDPDIALLDSEYPKSEFLGLYLQHPDIAEIKLVSDRLNDTNYQGVVMHEIGHALGLEHNSDADTLMFEANSNGSNTITREDVRQFCHLYHCKL